MIKGSIFRFYLKLMIYDVLGFGFNVVSMITDWQNRFENVIGFR